MEFKTCSKCGKSYLATTEFFSRQSKTRDGLQSWCKTCIAAEVCAWRDTHKAEVAAWNRAYRETHTEQTVAYNRVYRALHREYERHRIQASPKLRLNQVLRTAIWKSLHGRKGDRQWENLVGYTLEDLMRHLESKFQSGMTWDTYGDWHIDHLRPKSSFVFTSPEDLQFRECWALSNLQPLWAHDNLSKGAKAT